MGATNRVSMDVFGAGGQRVGRLTIALPGDRIAVTDPPPLLDLRGDPAREFSLPPVQLLEQEEYCYGFEPEPPLASMPITLEPREVFSPDGQDWRSGRLRTKLYTGTLPVVVRSGTAELGRILLEVRSRKLTYLDQYRWMLEEIADAMAELIMERFAPTEHTFAPDVRIDAATLYNRFALLKALFSGEAFESAVQQILLRPHRTWIEETELRRPGQPFPLSSGIARELGRPGPRVPWDTRLPVSSLPTRIPVVRTEETLDTPENRFIKFALETWRDFAEDVERALLEEEQNSPVGRGLLEVRSVLERLTELLAEPLFREVGRLTYFPASSQVLQKRAGYRDLFRAYLQFEAAARLTWDGGEDVYSAGKRDVAVLYEYWVFLQLVKVMERLCGRRFDRGQLLEIRRDGMGVSLRRGQAQCLKGTVTRYGRTMQVELWFNRTFSHLIGDQSSWSRPMRPDCSIRIQPDRWYGQTEEIWVHFDAKYRVESIVGLFGVDPCSKEEEERVLAQEQTPEAKQTPTRSDLLKMHAYRDAIRRSAGAYVIYPGNTTETLPKYHELLPGLGAFALRPTRDGNKTGIEELYHFLDDVIEHVARQTTQYERARFWLREAVRTPVEVEAPPAVPFLARPPADTLVLLGYVKNQRHLRWIHANHLYNLRAGKRKGSVMPNSRHLAAELVILYQPELKVVELWRVEGNPVVMTREEMLQHRYPDPKDVYFCLPLQEVPREEWPSSLTVERVRQVRNRVQPNALLGEPVVTTWLEVVR